jgi:hypothetical protein
MTNGVPAALALSSRLFGRSSYRSNNSDDEQIRDHAISQRLRKAANQT